MLEKLAKKFAGNSFVVSSYLAFRNFFSLVDDAIRKKLKKKPVLYLLEYHLAEHCNMNCRHCFHFSPLVNTEIFPDLDEFKRDIIRLSEIFENIRTIRLMGGEPLLNKELPQFIYEARKAFPKANIRLLSNGLLYKTVKGELLKAIKSCDVAIHVSLYKPMVHKKDDMERYFKDNGIKYWISDPVLHFAKYINIKGTSDPKKVVRNCPASRCAFLGNGNIARCPLPFNIGHLNKYFNQSINMEHELIDIHAPQLDGFALKRRLMQPMQSCRYCGKLEWVNWSRISPEGCGNVNIDEFCTSRSADYSKPS